MVGRQILQKLVVLLWNPPMSFGYSSSQLLRANITKPILISYTQGCGTGKMYTAPAWEKHHACFSGYAAPNKWFLASWRFRLR